jgi:hypothetical protein
MVSLASTWSKNGGQLAGSRRRKSTYLDDFVLISVIVDDRHRSFGECTCFAWRSFSTGQEIQRERYSRNRLRMLSLLSSSRPEVLARSMSRSSITSSVQLKNKMNVDSQTCVSNVTAWSIFRGNPSIKNRPRPASQPALAEEPAGTGGSFDRASRMAFSRSCKDVSAGVGRMQDGSTHLDCYFLGNDQSFSDIPADHFAEF